MCWSLTEVGHHVDGWAPVFWLLCWQKRRNSHERMVNILVTRQQGCSSGCMQRGFLQSRTSRANAPRLNVLWLSVLWLCLPRSLCTLNKWQHCLRSRLRLDSGIRRTVCPSEAICFLHIYIFALSASCWNPSVSCPRMYLFVVFHREHAFIKMNHACSLDLRLQGLRAPIFVVPLWTYISLCTEWLVQCCFYVAFCIYAEQPVHCKITL